MQICDVKWSNSSIHCLHNHKAGPPSGTIDTSTLALKVIYVELRGRPDSPLGIFCNMLVTSSTGSITIVVYSLTGLLCNQRLPSYPNR